MKDDQSYLAHVRDSLAKILDYTSDGRAAFFADGKTQDAVIRNFEIVGKAVKHLSDAFKDSHEDIPWRLVAGMRDRLIHQYFGVNLELVWDTVTGQVPLLLAKVEALLQEGEANMP